MSAEAVSGLIMIIRTGTWCVTDWLDLAVPRVVLTRDCLDSPEVKPGKKHTAETVCTDTKRGHRTLRLKHHHWTHGTDLGEDKPTEGNDTLI